MTYPEGDIPPLLKGRTQKVRRAVLAQDGHSAGEQSVYQALWNSATAETPETRVITIGFSVLSKLCRLDKSNCKNNVRTLIEKLAIEVVEAYDAISNKGTTYRLFSYKEILRRREAAHMTWVVRTCGVRFVNPEGKLPPGVSHPEGKTPPGPGGETPTGPGGKLPPPSLELLLRKDIGNTTTSSDPGPLQDAIETIAARSRLRRPIEVDDLAARKLEAFRGELGATVDETASLFVDKMLELQERKGIYSPVGILLEKPESWHTPRSLQKLREKRAEAQDKRAAEQAEMERIRQENAAYEKQLDAEFPNRAK